MSSKVCKLCGQSLPLSAFHRSKGNADGLRTECKVCRSITRKEETATYREKNREELRAKYDLKKRRKYYGRYKDKEAERRTKERTETPEKRRARNAINAEIRAGRVEVQSCERCGYAVGVHAHHEDYGKPLEVVWLCPPCHSERHREINAGRRKSAA